MNERLKTVLILGSGGLSIGQAGEFDYSGSQAIKALKEEGMRVILVNPNIATIQTSKDLADEVYFLPVTREFVEQVIRKEKPDGILLSFGGQTALNCGIALYEAGVLAREHVEVLGTPIETVIETEDRGLFVKALDAIGVKTPKSIVVHNIMEGLDAAGRIGYPVIIRAGFALGGLGSGFCSDEGELRRRLGETLSHSNHALVEESLQGWKEVEYEVMRDASGNTMTVCNMENLDPLGIHTGESIVVAPSQTLNDEEYHSLRRIAITAISHLGIIGECNIQFALDPHSKNYRVIEVNARLSRSSALASKATGYPIAFIAAKLSLGKRLIDLPNPVTGTTKAFFEPALDYVVVKFPRWDIDKFKYAEHEIGSSMKSVGEVMAIGRTFEEALQKAVRMIHPRLAGLSSILARHRHSREDLEIALRRPTDRRIFAIAEAFALGMDVEEIAALTMIDAWFLCKIRNIIAIKNELARGALTEDLILRAKRHGFSDREIALWTRGSEDLDAELQVRALRKGFGILPVVKQIDTLAAEYPCKTNYLYLTYNGDVDDVLPAKKGIIVLGSGPYSIGSSVEFDWCCVSCVKTIRSEGRLAIVINHNPETVSTDYDECDRLYFEELSLERVVDIYEKEEPNGVIVSMGGQLPNNLALPLSKLGVNILGTDPNTIDRVEDRHSFSAMLAELGIDQPEWKELSTQEGILSFCEKVGFPVLIRPSYVLSGSAMAVAYGESDLAEFLQKAMRVSGEKSVVVTKFITNAKEIDMDAVAKDGEVIAYAISEHVENAGVHSGDATLATPPQKLYVATMNRIKRICRQVVKELMITGPVNFQFIAKDNQIKIIECNLRASRSFPFVSKVYDVDFIRLATLAILGRDVSRVPSTVFGLEYLGVKAPQFSFTRIRGADPQLGVEMASTGEVACLGTTLEEAFLKSLLSTGFALPKKAILLSTGEVQQKSRLIGSVKALQAMGYRLYATEGTAQFYASQGIPVEVLHWPLDGKSPNIKEYIIERKIDLIINIPKSNEKRELSNDYKIRRAAADYSIPLITNAQCAELFVDAIASGAELEVKSWREYRESG